MKALEWIDKVLTHKTDDYINAQKMVSALVKIVTRTSREETAEVIEAFSRKNVIEIFQFDMPYPQAFLDAKGDPKVGGTIGNVSVRLADDHGVWESAETIREALRKLLVSCKADGRPYFIEAYKVEFIDTMRCQAFYSDGREIVREGRLL